MTVGTLRVQKWAATATLTALLTLCATGCTPSKDDGDKTPPEFAGVESIQITGLGSVRLTWQAATDVSLPITYEVYHATETGQEVYVAAPLATIEDATEVVVTDLNPGAGLRHFFVVRARDAAGNADANEKEVNAVFQDNGIEVLGHYIMDVAADIAVDGVRDIAAVSAWYTGEVHLVDVSDKAHPMLIQAINNLGYSPDLQLKDNWLYISHENEGHGIDIYDITDPSNPQLHKQVGPTTGYPASLTDCHNLWPQPDRDLLFCASSATGELVILSTGDTGAGAPDDPVYVTSLSVPGDWGIHDMYTHGNRLYAAFLDAGLYIYDITDPATPVELGSHTYSGAFTHNIWPNKDDTVLFTTDEVTGGHLRAWDISDPSDPTQIGEYIANQKAIIHNVEVVDNYAYISYYVEGLKVVDVSNPSQPREVGANDFYLGSDDDGYAGAWGVDPHPPYVYVSGIESGMWIHQFTPPVGVSGE